MECERRGLFEQLEPLVDIGAVRPAKPTHSVQMPIRGRPERQVCFTIGKPADESTAARSAANPFAIRPRS